MCTCQHMCFYLFLAYTCAAIRPVLNKSVYTQSEIILKEKLTVLTKWIAYQTYLLLLHGKYALTTQCL